MGLTPGSSVKEAGNHLLEVAARVAKAKRVALQAAALAWVRESKLVLSTPGKKVSLSQTGSSVIKGPTPAVTNNSGQIQFTVTDTKQETVVYKAIDESDGNTQLPQTASVAFGAGGGDNCGSTNFGNPNINAAPGFAMTPFATGFLPKNSNYGGLINGCRGASGIAVISHCAIKPPPTRTRIRPVAAMVASA